MVAISPHLKLAFTWIAYCNSRAVDKMALVMSDNFVSIVRPASLGYGPTGKQAYLDRLAQTPISFNISLPKPEDILESNDVVQFYTNANGQSEHGFPWKNEYMWTFRYEGDKLLSVTEFLDPTIVTTTLEKEGIVAEAELDCKKKR